MVQMIANILAVTALIASLAMLAAAVVSATSNWIGNKTAMKSMLALAWFDDEEKGMDADAQRYVDHLLDKTLKCARIEKRADNISFVLLWITAVSMIVRSTMLLVAGA